MLTIDGWQTDAGVIEILLAHPWAFGSGEQFENQNSDIYETNGGRHFEYLIDFLLILKST